MKKLTTGQFSKLANVTNRTIRYYDKVGLLKPSSLGENGYRYYCEEDFFKLQRILLLKQLGFSLEEIMTMAHNDDLSSLKESISMQIELVDKKIAYLTVLKETLKNTNYNITHNNMDWEKMIDLIKVINEDQNIIEQYHTSTNLNVRIDLHNKYSVSKINWFEWIYDRIDFSNANKLLEIGCGNGMLWKQIDFSVRNRDFYISDISKGMVDDAKRNINNSSFNYLVIDCMDISFGSNMFNIVIANHVLFYLKDLKKGLDEVSRVLKEDGIFYCTTYSSNHMKELTDIVKSYNKDIQLSNQKLYEIFGLENGKAILTHYFSEVEVKIFEDQLVITEAMPLVNYVLSCHGNQNSIIGKDIDKFREYIDNIIKKNGKIVLTKEACLFICKK